MADPLFKERLEFTDGSLRWWTGKILAVEVGAIGPTINELRMILDGSYVGMDLEEAIAVRDMLNRGIEVLKNNPKAESKG